MSGSDIATLIYGVLAILGTFFAIERLLTGDVGSALWPGGIAAFCIYRLATRDDAD